VLADLRTALEQMPVSTATTIVEATSFVYTTYIRTTPEGLWQAIAEPAFTQRYWGVALRSDAQVGATITCEVAGIAIADPAQVALVADPPRRLTCTWHSVTPEFIATVGGSKQGLDAMAAEPLSNVTFDLEPVGEPVRLTVTHAGFEPDS